MKEIAGRDNWDKIAPKNINHIKDNINQFDFNQISEEMDKIKLLKKCKVL